VYGGHNSAHLLTSKRNSPMPLLALVNSPSLSQPVT
jgi:hypothetical protein